MTNLVQICVPVYGPVFIPERNGPYLEPVFFHSISPHPVALTFFPPPVMLFLGPWSYDTDISFTVENKTQHIGQV